MADNVELGSASGGAIVKTDDDGTAHWQYVKVAFGADNTQTRVTSSVGLPVADGGGSLTVDNAGLTELAAAINASSQVDVNLAAQAGAITVDLGANNDVTLATLPDTAAGDLAAINTAVSGTLTVGSHAVTNAGTFAVQVDGDALTALQLIDNLVLAEDAAHQTGDVGVQALSVRQDTAAALSGTDGDYQPLVTDGSGRLHVNVGTGSVTANAGTNLNTSALALESGGNLATVAGAVSGTEMQVDVVASLPAGTNAIGKLAANSGVDIGDVDVTSISAGSNLIGDVGLSGARTSGGTTLYRNVDVDETEDAIKASGGQLYWLHAMNLTAAVLYLHIYNATTANVTVGSTTPDLTFPLPTTGDTNGAGFVLPVPNGIAFDTAITIACTTTLGGSSGPAANGVIVNAGYG